ncbi:ribosome-recycling factor, mitochondrial [Exaiptasia diaphana]|uniref:Ribosome-recycling factor, mitochondrial n=1 Tax=Exaiptasia diaphana TaxID=2652724 RepID=A0A913Y0B9_EXADI|nr:ribosome-recycling factor, mitochondrial [Exaiptasia diaphana]
MNSVAFRLYNSIAVNTTRTTFLRHTISRLYSSKKGKSRKKGGNIVYDPEMADGLVDFEKIRANMESAVMKLQQDFTTKYNVEMKSDSLDKVRVSTIEGKVPLSELAVINRKQDNMYVIDMSLSPDVTKAALQAIKESSINLEPVVAGDCITVPIPKVTQEYRQNLVKSAKQACEQSKQNIRKVRQKAMSDIRKNKKGRAEDDIKLVEKMVQQLTDEHTSDTDLLIEAKTKELLRK